jgi:hypothetical protein
MPFFQRWIKASTALFLESIGVGRSFIKITNHCVIRGSRSSRRAQMAAGPDDPVERMLAGTLLMPPPEGATGGAGGAGAGWATGVSP